MVKHDYLQKSGFDNLLIPFPFEGKSYRSVSILRKPFSDMSEIQYYQSVTKGQFICLPPEDANVRSFSKGSLPLAGDGQHDIP
jgi:hypothetical protein